METASNKASSMLFAENIPWEGISVCGYYTPWQLKWVKKIYGNSKWLLLLRIPFMIMWFWECFQPVFKAPVNGNNKLWLTAGFVIFFDIALGCMRTLGTKQFFESTAFREVLATGIKFAPVARTRPFDPAACLHAVIGGCLALSVDGRAHAARGWLFTVSWVLASSVNTRSDAGLHWALRITNEMTEGFHERIKAESPIIIINDFFLFCKKVCDVWDASSIALMIEFAIIVVTSVGCALMALALSVDNPIMAMFVTGGFLYPAIFLLLYLAKMAKCTESIMAANAEGIVGALLHRTCDASTLSEKETLALIAMQRFLQTRPVGARLGMVVFDFKLVTTGTASAAVAVLSLFKAALASLMSDSD